MPDAPLTLDFVPPLALGPAASFLLDVTLLGLALGALLVGLRVHARRLARAGERERRHLAAPPDFREGAHTVLRGTLVDHPASGPARVQITVHERRPDQTASFTEVWRDTIATPFELDTSGGVVHVELDPDAFVAADLDTIDSPASPHVGALERTRSVDLRAGASVLAYGVLHRESRPFGGYRGGAEGWTLRPPRGGRLLLLTSALERRYDERIALLRACTNLGLPLWLLFHAVYTLPFVAASFFGQQTQTGVLDVHQEVQRGGSAAPLAHVFTVSTATSDGLTIEARVKEGTARELEAAHALRAPLLRTGSWRAASYVGGEAWVSAPPVLAALLGSVAALLVLRVRYRRATPWYERTRR